MEAFSSSSNNLQASSSSVKKCISKTTTTLSNVIDPLATEEPDNSIAGFDSFIATYQDNPSFTTFLSNIYSIDRNNIVIYDKIYSLLMPSTNDDSVITGKHVDLYGKNGDINTTYMSAIAAKNEANKQGLELYANEYQVDELLAMFPGHSERNKIYLLSQLFGLAKSGYYDFRKKQWIGVGYIGTVGLSASNDYGNVRTLSRYNGFANVNYVDKRILQPYIAYKHVG